MQPFCSFSSSFVIHVKSDAFRLLVPSCWMHFINCWLKSFLNLFHVLVFIFFKYSSIVVLFLMTRRSRNLICIFFTYEPYLCSAMLCILYESILFDRTRFFIYSNVYVSLFAIVFTSSFSFYYISWVYCGEHKRISLIYIW